MPFPDEADLYMIHDDNLVTWNQEPSQNNIDAAGEYLSLCGEELLCKPTKEQMDEYHRLLREGGIDGFGVTSLRKWAWTPGDACHLTGPKEYKAKDILRASRLPLLPVDNPGVKKHLRHWKEAEPRNPVLLRVRPAADARPLEIADGYHRVCAAYWVDENTIVRSYLV